MVDEIILEYDYCDLVLDKVNLLDMEEKQRMVLWLRKRVDTILMQYPQYQHAFRDYDTLEHDILYDGIFKAYWANIEAAKKYVDEVLLSKYVMKYEQVPILNVRVNEPEYPPEYRIAHMKDKGYSDEDISKTAKTLGLQENGVREIIQNRDEIIENFDLKAFCRKLKEGKKAV